MFAKRSKTKRRKCIDIDEWIALSGATIHKQVEQAKAPIYRRPSPPPPPMYRRPCKVDGKPAIFHCWVADDRTILRVNTFVTDEERKSIIEAYCTEHVIPNCCSMEVARKTSALVEYRDGSVSLAEPERVHFLDREGYK